MKKSKKSVVFIITISVIALLSTVGAASYIYNAVLNHYKVTASNDFSFTSDLLKEGTNVPTYDIYFDWKTTSDTVPISFMLKNSDSALNISQMDIDFNVQSATGGVNQSGTLTGGTESQSTVTVNVPCTVVNNSFSVVLTATSHTPYKKTLTGKFVIHPLITYSFDSNEGKPVATMTISLAQSNVSTKDVVISWLDGAEPDMTNPIVIGATRNLSGKTMTVTLNTASVYKLVFFKNSPTANYSAVTVQGA